MKKHALFTLRWLIRFVLLVVVLLAGPLLVAACSGFDTQDTWYNADRSSAGIAPLPADEPEAIVQVYHARAFGWRGYFAVHTWIATKEEGASTYWVHEVTGWGSQKVRSRPAEPDTAWYGSEPVQIADIRGKQAARLIPQIQQAIADYPFQRIYEAWPGPNSNTFTAWIIRQVPELDVALPNTAIGKDYLEAPYVAATPSDSGYQLSLLGYAGVLASVREGLEVNVLGLSFGIDPMSLGIKVPGVGQLGLLDPWQPQSAPIEEEVAAAE